MNKKICFIILGVLIITSIILFIPKEKKKETLSYSVGSKRVAFTVDGEISDIAFPEQGGRYIGGSVTCENATGVWNNTTWKIELSNITGPTICTVNFIELTGDINMMAFTIDGEEVERDFPNKGEGYLGESVSCTNNTTATWNNDTWLPIFTSLNVPTQCTVNFINDPSLYAVILKNNPTRSTRSSFSAAFTTSNNGNTIYTAAGQGGAYTYYFAGAVSNNYVLFAGKYWRIVRINEDSSVRLIYAGTSAGDTAGFISTSQAFNTSYNNSAYVGYKYTASAQYGTGTDSPIKTVVDNWYRDNINASYGNYVSKTAIYCNDRTIGSGSWCASCGTTFYYSAFTRLYTNKTPTFACSNAADKFTASTSTGNNALTYPVGLITADEISYAGGVNGANNATYYIAQNASTGATYWWTMSPWYWLSSNGYANEFMVGGSSVTGYLTNGYVSGARGVRPVLSLKSCVQWSSGDGTSESPYQVSVSAACAAAEN